MHVQPTTPTSNPAERSEVAASCAAGVACSPLIGDDFDALLDEPAEPSFADWYAPSISLANRISMLRIALPVAQAR